MKCKALHWKLESINHCLFSYKIYGLDLLIYVLNRFSKYKDYMKYLKDLKIR